MFLYCRMSSRQSLALVGTTKINSKPTHKKKQNKIIYYLHTHAHKRHTNKQKMHNLTIPIQN